MSNLTEKIRSAAAIAERIENHGGNVLSLRAFSESTRETRVVPGPWTDTDDVRRILDDARIVHEGVTPYRCEIAVRESERPSGAVIVVQRTADQLPEIGSTPNILLQVVSDLEEAGLDVHAAAWVRRQNRMFVNVMSTSDVDMTHVVRGCSLNARRKAEPGWYSGDLDGMRLVVMP